MAFKKGDPGGPGRPKGHTLSDEIRKVLERKEPRSGKLYKILFAEALVKLAVGGDSRAAALVLERSDGKVPLAIEGGELPVLFTLATDDGSNQDDPVS